MATEHGFAALARRIKGILDRICLTLWRSRPEKYIVSGGKMSSEPRSEGLAATLATAKEADLTTTPSAQCESSPSRDAVVHEQIHPDLQDLSTDALYCRLLNMVLGDRSKAEGLIAYEQSRKKGYARHVYIAWAIEQLWQDRR